jgi:hypothetical protein
MIKAMIDISSLIFKRNISSEAATKVQGKFYILSVTLTYFVRNIIEHSSHTGVGLAPLFSGFAFLYDCIWTLIKNCSFAFQLLTMISIACGNICASSMRFLNSVLGNRARGVAF